MLIKDTCYKDNISYVSYNDTMQDILCTSVYVYIYIYVGFKFNISRKNTRVSQAHFLDI